MKFKPKRILLCTLLALLYIRMINMAYSIFTWNLNDYIGSVMIYYKVIKVVTYIVIGLILVLYILKESINLKLIKKLDKNKVMLSLMITYLVYSALLILLTDIINRVKFK